MEAEKKPYIVTHGSISAGRNERGLPNIIGLGETFLCTEEEAAKINGPHPAGSKPPCLTPAATHAKQVKAAAASKAILAEDDEKPAVKPELHPAPSSHGKGGVR